MSREVIPPVLAPYLTAGHDNGPSLSLVTSTLETPAHWLIIRYLYSALSRSKASQQYEIPKQPAPFGNENAVGIFVSFLQPKDLWLELGKKVGLDLPSLAKSKQLIYIDGLALAAAESNDTKTDSNFSTIPLPTLSLHHLSKAITTAIQSTSARPQSTTIIIDGIDFLLAAAQQSSPPSTGTTGTTTTAQTTQQLLSHLTTLATHTVITLHADSPLLHNNTTPLETSHASLLITLAHQARYVLQLRGLSTGTAKGITGVVRISRGGGFDDDDDGNKGGGPASRDEVGGDGEWLYQWKGDGSVRVWVRGE